jgi:Flp pilus assembly protein TadG
MRGFGFFRRKAAAFATSEAGNFAVITAITLTALMLAVGFSINTVEMMLTRSNLQQALDAAITSTARDLTTGGITPEDARPTVTAFLTANGGTGFASADEIALDDLDVDQGSKTVSAQASVALPLLFPVFGGSSIRTITVASAAKYSDQSMEVSMVLDVTGSMAFDPKNSKLKNYGKINGLKVAATDAVQELFAGQNPENPRVKIAIVPFADSVNVGPSLAKSTVFPEKSMQYRNLEIASTDPLPANYYKNYKRPDNCATERKVANQSDDQYSDQYNDVGPDVLMPHRDYLLTDFANGKAGWGTSQTCPSAALVPLTTDQTDLTDLISNLAPNGGTAGHIGIQWGWYMLSPHWASVLPSTSAPAAYDPTKVTKVMILMTDGEFNLSYYDVKNSHDAYNQNGKQAPVDAATTLCANMKAKGIQIFTIGFGLPSDEAAVARQTLKDCATPDTPSVKYFYEATDNDELDATFKAIVADLQKELVLTR